MALIEVAPDGCLLERSVHSLDLAVGPGMIGLGETMVDVVLGTGQLEAVRPHEFATIEGLADVVCRRGDIAGRCELHPIVCQHGVHLVGHCLDQASEEVRGVAPGRLVVQLDESEF